MATSRRFIDISLPLSPETIVWPGDPPVVIRPVSSTAGGDDYNVAVLTLSSHTGTHVDAPWHALNDGARLGSLQLDGLIGPCFVCDLRRLDRHIAAVDLEGAAVPPGVERLLLRTRNSDLWDRPDRFTEDFIGLTPDAAGWILGRGIRLIGVDYLSVEPFAGDGSVHTLLLGGGVIALESLDLRQVEPGPYQLICLPLNLPLGDGAPCRAVLAPLGDEA